MTPVYFSPAILGVHKKKIDGVETVSILAACKDTGFRSPCLVSTLSYVAFSKQFGYIKPREGSS